MTTAWPAAATLAVGTDAINSTSFATIDAARAALKVNSTGASSTLQSMAGIATLVPAPLLGSRATQVYVFLQPGLAQQGDIEQMLALLLVYASAASCPSQWQTSEMFHRIIEIAKLSLYEVYGMHKTTLHRVDDDQFAWLQSQIATARAANGLSALPTLRGG